jgi:hypothetical protein
MRKLAFVSALATVLGFHSATVNAAPLGPVEYSGGVAVGFDTSGGNLIQLPFDGSTIDVANLSGSLNVSSSLAPPSLHAHGTSADQFFESGATLDLKYQVVAHGPVGGIAHVLINASGAVTSTGNGSGSTFFVDDTPGFPAFSEQQGQSWSLSGSFQFNANQIHLLEIAISAETIGPGSYTAFVDPTIVLDPAFADSTLFTLEFSPEVANATPLPAALPLFAGGLGFIGLIARRKNRKEAV